MVENLEPPHLEVDYSWIHDDVLSAITYYQTDEKLDEITWWERCLTSGNLKGLDERGG
uniref:Uncharacterized protein n=1 Tax=Medicago truncatula TaxID=3880 RepID=Q1SKZ0_MEDTR|nr:hypothetical protein MtrDRAFT_AC140549g30v2 [Medicago truncatula]